MLNSIGAVFLIVLVAVAAFSLAMAGYYISSMSTGLEAKAKTATGYFSNYKSESEYLQAARSHVENFEEKAYMEVQFLNPAGNVIYSSYGLTLAGSMPGTLDIGNAISNRVLSSWTGNFEQTGEHIMAVSSPLVYNGTVVGVLRYVTSMRVVDRQIIAITAFEGIASA